MLSFLARAGVGKGMRGMELMGCTEGGVGSWLGEGMIGGKLFGRALARGGRTAGWGEMCPWERKGRRRLEGSLDCLVGFRVEWKGGRWSRDLESWGNNHLRQMCSCFYQLRELFRCIYNHCSNYRPLAEKGLRIARKYLVSVLVKSMEL